MRRQAEYWVFESVELLPGQVMTGLVAVVLRALNTIADLDVAEAVEKLPN